MAKLYHEEGFLSLRTCKEINPLTINLIEKLFISLETSLKQYIDVDFLVFTLTLDSFYCIMANNYHFLAAILLLGKIF